MTGRTWYFGDGGTGGGQTAAYVYQNPGTYDVTLTVTGPGGFADSEVKLAYIDVRAASESPVGLVAAYGFEEVDDVWVVDSSGNGNDGVLSGANRTNVGRFGKALTLDGVNDWVDLRNLDVSDGDGLTIAFWMMADDFGTYDARLVSKAAGVNDQDHYWMVSTFSNGSIRFRLKAGGSTTTLVSDSGVTSPGNWHYVAATYNQSLMRVYVDGSAVGSISKSGDVDGNSGVPAALGNQPQGDRPFDGRIDEVRIYNRALTAQEILADMERPVNTASVPVCSGGEVMVSNRVFEAGEHLCEGSVSLETNGEVVVQNGPR